MLRSTQCFLQEETFPVAEHYDDLPHLKSSSGGLQPPTFCSESIKTFPCLYILAWKGTESLKAGAPELLQSQDGAARGEAPQELNRSHSTSLCRLLGKSEGIPGVFQPPWLLLCQVQAGRIPRVQLSTSSSPVGDNNHITLLGFPSVLNKNPSSQSLLHPVSAQSEKIKALVIFLCSVTLWMNMTFLTAVI